MERMELPSLTPDSEKMFKWNEQTQLEQIVWALSSITQPWFHTPVSGMGA